MSNPLDSRVREEAQQEIERLKAERRGRCLLYGCCYRDASSSSCEYCGERRPSAALVGYSPIQATPPEAAELAAIDRVLDRRGALSDSPTRIDKIMLLLKLAQAADPKGALAKAEAEVTRLKERPTVEQMSAALAVLKEEAERQHAEVTRLSSRLAQPVPVDPVTGRKMFSPSMTPAEHVEWLQWELSKEVTKSAEFSSRLAQQEQAQGWRPIETAPKDGATVLVYGVVEGEDLAWFKLVYPCNGYDHGATHWQPLPPAPQDTP